MNRYRVYTQYCGTIDIEAETVRVQRQSSIDGRSIKIVFLADNEVIAEFFGEQICGWKQIETIKDYAPECRR